jgi:hypothetical protein
MDKKQFKHFTTLAIPHLKDMLKEASIKPVPKNKRAIMREMTRKNCYSNAARYVCRYPNSDYVLGYAAGIIPVEHAWVATGTGQYDPTWEKFTGIGHTYMEVIRLDFDALEAWLLAHELMPPSLFDLYRAGQFQRL